MWQPAVWYYGIWDGIETALGRQAFDCCSRNLVHYRHCSC